MIEDMVGAVVPVDRLRGWLAPVRQRVEALLAGRLARRDTQAPSRLCDAMHYAVFSGGKRMRPALVAAAAQAASRQEHVPDLPAVWHAAAAIELIHCFSLVHDDLPAMDDDDVRRGRPTLHRAFDEWTAILVGDALSVLAFEVLVDSDIPCHVGMRLARQLAADIGWGGVVAGQYRDIQAQGQKVTTELVYAIHSAKTAALLRCACSCGAIAVDAADDTVRVFARLGEELGLAFQAVDDVLDEVGAVEQVGKRVGKDRLAGKATLPAVVGVDATVRIAREHVRVALGLLDGYGDCADPLRHLASCILTRSA